MAKLIYAAIASLNGYVADEQGNFSWSTPDPEIHAFVNDLERPLGTYLYGRRMYEVMKAWGNDDFLAEIIESDHTHLRDYAEIWRAADKIVYSRTLTSVSAPRTRLETTFDPAAVRQLKQSANRDLGIGGPDLAAQALEAGLVDEVQLFLAPVAVAAGKPVLPIERQLSLCLIDHRTFGNGTIYLRYGTRRQDRRLGASGG